MTIKERIRKAYIAWYSWSECLERTWRLKPKIVKWWYSGGKDNLIYGCLVWRHVTKTRYIGNWVNAIQRTALLGICGGLASTPTSAMEVLLGLEPIVLFVETLAAKSAIRLWNSGDFIKAGYGHREILENFGISQLSTDTISKEFNFREPVPACFPSREDWRSGLVLEPGEISVYVDGSKTDKGTGSGVHVEELDIEESLKL